MSQPPSFETLRAVTGADLENQYVLVFGPDGQPTRVGPLAEYSVRGELARLGFAGTDIDVRIETARMDRETVPAAS